MFWNLATLEQDIPEMDPNLGKVEWDNEGMGTKVFTVSQYIFGNFPWLTLDLRIRFALRTIQPIYYPLLAIVAVPVNIVTIVVLSRGKCGLSKGVTLYLVAMAAADLLVVFLDLILRQIPIAYREHFNFLWYIPVCNIHAVLLYAATDCSVWFTVTFTLDRCVAICCQKLKTKYCTERTAAVVLGTVTALSCLKNIFWYFMLRGIYRLANDRWFCFPRADVVYSAGWAVFEIFHFLLTPVVPFVLVLLLNALTVRHVLVASRARRRLRGPGTGERPRDAEMESRRKSLILLLVISGNFILLWTVFTVYSAWYRQMYWKPYSLVTLYQPYSLEELGLMLQLLSCCTNTALYAMTQTLFREQLKEVVKSACTLSVRCTRC